LIATTSVAADPRGALTPRAGQSATTAAPILAPIGRGRMTSNHGTETIIGREMMLYGLILILVVLWVLGLATSYTLGGLIHILLVIAVVVFVMNMLAGRRA
jgi:hypothetical protein